MVMLALAARAAPVVCDPGEAERILTDARIDERRAPVTHPQLVPGLARGSDPAVAAVLERLCRPGGELAVERGDSWTEATASAHVLVVSRVEPEGCGLRHERVPISVGIGGDGIRYGLLGTLPTEHTPVGECPRPAVWRREQVLEGADGPVRLVLATDHLGDVATATRLSVRRATPAGWSEQVLFEPYDGSPAVHLARRGDGTPLVVASRCGEQTVWTPGEDGWKPVSGRDALTLLAREGSWRLAGQDGWLLVLAQDDEEDAYLVGPRLRRLQKRDPEPLYLMSSSDFPELHAGYVMIAPGPWPTEAEAEAARHRWGRSASVQVRKAWSACAGG